jgi:acyl carrier protein
MSAAEKKSPQSAEILEWLADWFARRGAIGRPRPDDFSSANFFQRCWVDSFGVVELIEDTERRFGVSFTPAELDDANFGVVERFAELLEQARARSSGARG